MGIDDADDLKNAIIPQTVDPIAHGSFGNAYFVRDRRVRHPPIVLETCDDRKIDVV
jgi:hypothetical protein